MPRFVTLLKFTRQGIAAYWDTTARALAMRRRAESMGVQVCDQYWTLGDHDGLLILDGEERAVMSLLFWLGSQGSVRTTTLRAFSQAEIEEVLKEAQ